MKFRLSPLLIFVFFCSGCSILSHSQELLTLKDYADEGEAQERYIKAQDQKFDRLLVAVRDNSLEQYSQRKIFLKTFGDPVYIKETSCQNEPCEEWLYRYAVKTTGSDKVYAYFAKSGDLLKWSFVPAQLDKEKKND